jgi:methionyl-tRNA formyltransferase
MRIVFIGASRFGLRCLDSLRDLAGVEIVGAVTAPQRFPISYRPEGVTNVLYADVEDYCRTNGIPCATIADGMRDPALLATVEAWRPDAFLVAGWYHMVPKKWRALAPAYGMHASLLPDYSGGAPLVWAIIAGEQKTGITLFQLGDGVDDGPILGQAETPIADDDTIATLYARIEDIGVGLLRTHLPRLADGTAQLIPQDESRRRTVPQRSPEDGAIDWRWGAKRIYDFVRAQTRPYPGAFTRIDGHVIHIWSSRVSETQAPPGIAAAAGPLVIGCGDGRSLEVLEMAVDGEDIAVADWWSAQQAMGGPHAFA